MYASPQLTRWRKAKRKEQKRKRENEKVLRSKKRRSLEHNVPSLSLSIQQEEPIKNAINFLKRSQNENKTHSANICVICDQFIKGITIFSEQKH